MRKILILGLAVAMCLCAAFSAMGDSTLALPSLSGVPIYANAYVGPIPGTLDGADILGGVACVDVNTATSVPNTGFAVYVGKLDPVDLSNAKFGSDAAALWKYQQAAWLLGQIPMQTESSEIGEIQFAMWRIFTPIANDDPKYPGRNITGENEWMSWAAAINPSLYDFSVVSIYTPTNSVNQEFMSGVLGPPSAVPVPPTVLLMGSGLVGMGLLGWRRKRS